MKALNLSSIAALVAGGTLALLPLDSVTEQVLGVAIAFVILNAINYLTRSKEQG
jgi:ribose/xylose/arabinose/galactoside ABC-type transport system permease subunit